MHVHTYRIFDYSHLPLNDASMVGYFIVRLSTYSKHFIFVYASTDGHRF